jgi:hypothetical protein
MIKGIIMYDVDVEVKSQDDLFELQRQLETAVKSITGVKSCEPVDDQLEDTTENDEGEGD